MGPALLDGDLEKAAPPRFLRTFSMPAAAPWDQMRAARLNALHNAPVPGPQVAICLRRLDPWRPNLPARFCAAYVRSADVVGKLILAEQVEGVLVEFVFSSAAAEGARRRRLLRDVGLGAALVLTLVGATLRGQAIRADENQQISRAMRLDLQALRAQTSAARLRRNVRALIGTGVEHRSGGDLAADLTWLASVRRPHTPLKSLVWRDGQMLLTGSGSPPVDGPVAKMGDANGGPWRVQRPDARPASLGAGRPSIVSTPSPVTARRGGQ